MRFDVKVYVLSALKALEYIAHGCKAVRFRHGFSQRAHGWAANSGIIAG
jgi:hypothetical protein